MMHEEVKKYRELSGDTNPNTPISRIGGYLDGYEKALEQTGWIPVSARLPESEGYGHYFLCCLENGIIRILGYSNILTTCCPKGFYYEEENGTTWRQDINPVIAWMPLPAPFEPQESEVIQNDRAGKKIDAYPC